MSAESFTVLAILEARDRASEIFAKVDESLDKFSETAAKAGETAKAAGDAIDESLLKTASGADALDVASARVDAAQEKATRTAEAQADAERNLLEAHKAAAAAADDDVASQYRLMEADQRLTAAAKENAAAQKTLSDAQKVQADTATAAAAKNDVAAESQKAVSDASKESGINLGSMGKIAGIAALGMGVAGAIMIKAAGNFQDSTTHLVTDAGESAKNLGMVQAGILQVSTATGTSAADITNAMYHIESGGFHAASGLALLKVAAEGARVGGADLDTVSKTLVGTMNAYYGSTTNASNATQRSTSMMNELIATVGAGDMRMQDLASSLSAVAPLAAKVHLSFAQVGGAIATMTAQGMSAQQATQDLANTIRGLSNPNNVAISEMNQLGINAQDVSEHLGSRGLTGTLDMLTKAITDHMGKSGEVLMSAFTQSTTAGQDLQTMLKTMPAPFAAMAKGFMDGQVSAKQWRTELQAQTPVNQHLMTQFATLYEKSHSFNDLLAKGGPAAQTYTAALAKMMGGATGLNTALMLTGKSAGTFAGNAALIDAAGKKAGSSVSNWSTIQGTFNFKLDSAKTAVENTGIAIGSALLPAATSLMQTVVAIVEPIVEWTSSHKTLTAVLFGGVAAIAATIAVLAVARKAYNAVTGAVNDVKKVLQAVGIISKESAATQAASAEEAATAQETAAGESAAAQEEAAAESSSSWIASAAKTTAAAVASAARTLASWAVTGAGMVAQAAVWVASNTAKVAVVVAENIAGAATTMAAWIAANAAMLAGIGLIVVVIIAAVALIVTHWKQISAFAKKVFDDVLHIVESVINWVKSHWPLLLGILLGPIALAAALIYMHWRGVMHGAAEAVDWIRGHWQLLLAILTGPIGLATLFIVDHWRQIVDGARAMLHDVVSFFENLNQRVISIVDGLAGDLFSAGARVVSYLAHGIESAIGDVTSAIGHIGGEILSHLPFSPAKKGPLSGAGSPDKRGLKIAQMLAQGMIAGEGSVAAASHLLASSAALGPGGSLTAGGAGLRLSALGPGGAGAGGVTIVVDVHDNTVMSDSDITKLVAKIERQLVPKILPAAGRKVRS